MKVWSRLHLQIGEVVSSSGGSLLRRLRMKGHQTNKKICSAKKNTATTPSLNKHSSVLLAYKSMLRGKAQRWLRLLAAQMKLKPKMRLMITLPNHRVLLQLLSVRMKPPFKSLTTIHLSLLQVKICSSQGISKSSRGWLFTSIRHWRLNSSALRTGALPRSNRFLKGSALIVQKSTSGPGNENAKRLVKFKSEMIKLSESPNLNLYESRNELI